jgi:hypothetical protein
VPDQLPSRQTEITGGPAVLVSKLAPDPQSVATQREALGHETDEKPSGLVPVWAVSGRSFDQSIPFQESYSSPLAWYPPTTMQKSEVVQEILPVMPIASSAILTGWAQEDPVHAMVMSLVKTLPSLLSLVVWPTAMQSVSRRQETEEILRSLSVWTADQPLPVHVVYLVVPRPVIPLTCPLINMQNVGPEQEIVLGPDVLPTGKEVVEDQEEPFQIV